MGKLPSLMSESSNKSKGSIFKIHLWQYQGNTLLNFCGIGKEMLEYTVDISPHKQGLFLPGTHIPIKKPETIHETKPDYVVILSWNFKDEIMHQMEYIREWGGKFVVFHPKIEVF